MPLRNPGHDSWPTSAARYCACCFSG
jgi:hypothetical protein